MFKINSSSIFLAITLKNIFKESVISNHVQSSTVINTADTTCKLTVNGGIGMNGPCTFNSDTGELSFQVGFLKQLVALVCQTDDLEVIRGGVFGRIMAKDDTWEFCWNNGGIT